MESNEFIKISINLTDMNRGAITEFEGKKYLLCELHERKTPDAYGNTHYVSVRVKNADGTYATEYIGKGKKTTFGKAQGNERQPSVASSTPSAIASQARELDPQQNPDDLPF